MNHELVAKASSCRIYKSDEGLILKREPFPSLNVAIFVCTLLTIIPGSAGIAFLFNPEMAFAGFILLLIAGPMSTGLYLLVRKKRSINHLQFDQLATICEINSQSDELLDAKRNKLDSLENVRMEKLFQMTSSSKKLVLKYSKGRILVANGNPFSGGTSELEAALKTIID